VDGIYYSGLLVSYITHAVWSAIFQQSTHYLFTFGWAGLYVYPVLILYQFAIQPTVQKPTISSI